MSGDEPIRRLLPDVAETTVADQVAALDLVALAHPERPYVITNFALTLDGHATISGRSGAIGSATDTAMLVGLRTRVDAVMIGAGTMRAERYGRVIGDPAKRERREAEGLSPDPLMVDRLGEPRPALGRAAVHRGSRANSDRDRLRWRAAPDRDAGEPVPRAGRALPGRRCSPTCARSEGVRALLCEGGPRLHAELIANGLVDELFVTHAPKLAGGVGPGFVSGLAEEERGLELGWLLADADAGELFGRYLVP